MPAASSSPFDGNRLLQDLHDADRALLAPHLEPTTYAKGDVIFAAGTEVGAITFPCRQTVVTLLIAMQDGRSAETATIGCEGAVGGVVSDGRVPASTSAVVQIGGPALRLDAAHLQEAKRRSATLRALFTRYSDCLLAQVLQSVACNALHPIEARCLRWLLTLQDRIAGDVLPVTHEQLAAMLGVQRTYLTRILSTLQAQGLLRVGRGRITVLDRAAMVDAACECHGAVHRHYDTVLGAGHAVAGPSERAAQPGRDGIAARRDAAR
ncbi:Crp/Fnr family transcriptional regulator [Methylobacterium sp. WL103]|uniref:Crp/Fnr family transcriptional regulator n=1 Tax=Methylobacterium sp. WL103 TaxID=2603891 RepID=UPI0011C92103|nr:Crp/Fnr family transcriptional regulator [Methylobacterium sp. WL103]TXN00416.1 Crp/Fnr family transcriptional regulator [Methylobacterium sp. WL103]